MDAGMTDILVIGAGPAGLAIAAAFARQGLRVVGLAAAPEAPWPNTYGVWVDEIAHLELAHLLEHRWSDCAVYAAGREFSLGRDYGLFDNARLQEHLLAQCERGGMRWEHGSALEALHTSNGTVVVTTDGRRLAARLVVDASGHHPSLISRPPLRGTAYQAAYGIVGTFTRPPVRPGQLVLMDYRAEHLPSSAREPATFLYAMDLGGGRFFVEETSLAHAPGLKLELLEQRLYRRLAWMGVEVQEVHHTERCFFPMNPPLPDLRQPTFGYGGAASMVHPPSGYLVGHALRRAPEIAQAVAAALGSSGPQQAAQAAWLALWPRERVRRRALYLFGLASIMRCREPELQAFFGTFFQLPPASWQGYLSDTLSTRELLGTMVRLFLRAPMQMRFTLMRSAGLERRLLWQALGG
jgi:lycopene beta-cyclase